MFLMTSSSIWCFCVFLPTTYVVIVLSFVLYSLPLLSNASSLNTNGSNRTSFSFIQGTSIANLIQFTLSLIFLNSSFWFCCDTTSWFGHLIFSSFQSKSQIVIFFAFSVYLYMFCSVSYFTSRDPYDFCITTINIYYWVLLLFMANSIITVIFVIEVLSALLFLLLVTSSLSTAFYYRNNDLSEYNFLSNSLPSTFIQSIMYFFWISLIGSLNLFFFTIFLYQKLFSFDWFLLEHVFYFTVSSASYKELYSLCIVWSVFLFSILTKCGIAPFFIWKPTFFKGLSLHTIAFYICFFYYAIFLFFIHLLSSYFHYLTYFYAYALLVLVLVGIALLLTVLCETFYIKTFLAISSILNSLLLLLAVSSPHVSDVSFFL